MNLEERSKVLKTIRMHEGLLQICVAIGWDAQLGNSEKWIDLVEWYDAQIMVVIPDHIQNMSIFKPYCNLGELRKHKEEQLHLRALIDKSKNNR